MCTYITTLHQENSPSRIQFYMQKTKSSLSTTTTSRGQRDLHSRIQKRNSMHRRQGDLLEYICVFQRHSRHSSLSRHSRHSSLSSLSRHSSHSRHSRDIPDIPVIHDLPAFPGNSTILQSSKYPQGIQPITAFSD